MFFTVNLSNTIRFFNYFVILLFIFQGRVESGSITVDTIEDVKLPKFFGCVSGYQTLKNFSCLGLDPAIPPKDQVISNSDGFWSGCYPNRNCEFSYYKQADVYVNSISFLAYFVGDSQIDIEIPGHGIPVQTLKGSGWTGLQFDLTRLGDYQYFATIKITPTFVSETRFAIIDIMVFNTDEPTTT